MRLSLRQNLSMSKHDETIYIKHILEAANKITLLVNRGGKELYDSDFAVADAIVRELLVVGEAAKRLSSQTKLKYNAIPWKDVIGMRNWLVHGYSEIDWDRVWNTAIKDIPQVIFALSKK